MNSTPLPPPPGLTPPPPPPPAPAPVQSTLDADILRWESLQLQITKLKAEEMGLRKSIADRMFAEKKNGSGLLPQGTSRVNYEGSSGPLEAKLNQKWTYNVLVEQMKPVLEELTPLNPRALDLVKIEYNFSKTVYNELTPAQQLIADRMLLVKPGTVSLEIKHLPKDGE